MADIKMFDIEGEVREYQISKVNHEKERRCVNKVVIRRFVGLYIKFR